MGHEVNKLSTVKCRISCGQNTGSDDAVIVVFSSIVHFDCYALCLKSSVVFHVHQSKIKPVKPGFRVGHKPRFQGKKSEDNPVPQVL